ncbi:MAG: hypothetical protein ABH828_02005 [archaeon]
MNKEKKDKFALKLFLSSVILSYSMIVYGFYKSNAPPKVKEFNQLEQKLNSSISIPYKNIENYLSEEAEVDLSYVDSLRHEKKILETSDAYISENNIYQNEKKKGAIVGWIGAGALWLQLFSTAIYSERLAKKGRKSKKLL